MHTNTLAEELKLPEYYKIYYLIYLKAFVA